MTEAWTHQFNSEADFLDFLKMKRELEELKAKVKYLEKAVDDYANDIVKKNETIGELRRASSIECKWFESNLNEYIKKRDSWKMHTENWDVYDLMVREYEKIINHIKIANRRKSLPLPVESGAGDVIEQLKLLRDKAEDPLVKVAYNISMSIVSESGDKGIKDLELSVAEYVGSNGDLYDNDTKDILYKEILGYIREELKVVPLPVESAPANLGNEFVSAAWTWLAKQGIDYTDREHGDCFKAIKVLRALRIAAEESGWISDEHISLLERIKDDVAAP